MLSESAICLPRAGCPFHTTAKRYWLPEFKANSTDPDALTLILLHSTSFHKETWEPTLYQIFQRACRPDSSVKLREAWALDCPNHGEAVQYNQDVLRQDEHLKSFTCQKYAHAVYSFLTAQVNEGAQIDFRKRKLVGIGHSLGANAILLVQKYEEQLPFLSLVIIEPMVSPEGSQHLGGLSKWLINRAKNRKCSWKSKEEAKIYFTQSENRFKWDMRVIDLYVDHGLCVNPAADSSQDKDKVTLVCTPEQEMIMYGDREGATKPVEVLNEICEYLPIYLILGENCDLIPPKVQQALVNLFSNRRYVTTIKIPEVGHLVPQKKPDELGFVIFEKLVQVQEKSRL